MNLDNCDCLFSLQLFRTLPVGYILGCLLVCVLSISFLLFYSTASELTPCNATTALLAAVLAAASSHAICHLSVCKPLWFMERFRRVGFGRDGWFIAVSCSSSEGTFSAMTALFGRTSFKRTILSAQLAEPSNEIFKKNSSEIEVNS